MHAPLSLLSKCTLTTWGLSLLWDWATFVVFLSCCLICVVVSKNQILEETEDCWILLFNLSATDQAMVNFVICGFVLYWNFKKVFSLRPNLVLTMVSSAQSRLLNTSVIKGVVLGALRLYFHTKLGVDLIYFSLRVLNFNSQIPRCLKVHCCINFVHLFISTRNFLFWGAVNWVIRI